MRTVHLFFLSLVIALNGYAQGAVTTPTPNALTPPVIVTDDEASTLDLSNGEDIDLAEERQLAVKWNINVADAQTFHIYVSDDGKKGEYLAAVSATVKMFVWGANTPAAAAKFRSGPQFDHTYQFQIIAVSGIPFKILGRFDHAGPVKFLEEKKAPQVFVTDDEASTLDLSNGEDIDLAEARKLAIKWDIEAADAQTFHIYVSDDGKSAEYLTVVNATVKVFAWGINTPTVSAKFRSGPQFGHTYKFAVIAVSGLPFKVLGRFENAGPVKFTEEKKAPEVIVTDDEESTLDLSNGEDRDLADARKLAIKWDVEVADAQTFHVYVIDDGKTAEFLTIVNATVKVFAWGINTPAAAAKFRSGPQFGHSYQFKVFAVSGLPFKVLSRFENAGPVQFLEGTDLPTDMTPSAEGSPTPTVTPTKKPEITPTLLPVIVTDNLLTFDDLSNKTDYDLAENRALVIRWNMDVTDVGAVHIYLFEKSSTDDEFPADPAFLGFANKPSDLNFVWKEKGTGTSPLYNKGPQFDYSYRFRVILISQNRKVIAKYNTVGPVDFKQGEDLIPTIKTPLITPVRTPIMTPAKTPILTPPLTPIIPPEFTPKPPQCVEAGDFFTAPADDLKEVQLGVVKILEAVLEDGTEVPLSIADCGKAGRLGVVVPWSESTASKFAVIQFMPEVCDGAAPVAVEITLTHGTPVKLIAFDDSGGIVDAVSDSGSDASDTQTFLLKSSMGIRTIRIEGAEICILRICWQCRVEIPPVEYTPEPSKCVEPSEYFTEPIDDLKEVELGPVKILEANLADGTEVPLSVSACGPDGVLGVQIPWSDPEASKFAAIEFSDEICGGAGPLVVEITLTHGSPVTLTALDEMGFELNVVSDPGSDATVQTLVLRSLVGIKTILIEGNQICILKICWRCIEYIPEWTPVITPEFTPQPPECVEASEFFTGPADNLSEVVLDPIVIKEAFLADGAAVPLSVSDCSTTGRLGVNVPWSESTASKFAVIDFASDICPDGLGPKFVEITLTHGTAITLTALDAMGSVVDAVSDSGSDASLVQPFVLRSSAGIRSIQINGAEICILKICWLCVSEIPIPEWTPIYPPDYTPPLTPLPHRCVSASDFFAAPTAVEGEVVLGAVKVLPGVLADGTIVPLNINDCNEDGILDVNIPWSESTGSAFAMIEFMPEVCGGSAPQLVEITLTHGTPIKLTALDESNAAVDLFDDPGSDSSLVQVVILNSPTGIRKVQIEGAEICILKICWVCKTEVPIPEWTPIMTPVLTPLPQRCVSAGDFFTASASELSEVLLGPVKILPGVLSDGTVVPLSVNDCNGDSRLDVNIPWSESTASAFAKIEFMPEACEGIAPQFVEIALTHGTPIKLTALDDANAAVDVFSDPGSDASLAQVVILKSPMGIRSIQIEGAEICILKICWICVSEITPEKTPLFTPMFTPMFTPQTPLPEICVSASEFFTTSASGLNEVLLGPVKILPGVLADGTIVPLNVNDCNSDGRLDVNIPWSESTASAFAVIQFATEICGGVAPQVVEITLTHGTPIKLTALDDANAAVDIFSDPGSDPSSVQTAILKSPMGIRTIQIEGAEICILKICWYCAGEIIPGWTPVITPFRTPIVTPILPTPIREVTVTDDSLSFRDLSGAEDYDLEENRELVIRWDIKLTGITFYHIWVYVDNAAAPVYLGQSADPKDNFLVWRKNSPRISKEFRNGPQFGHSYQFQVVAMKSAAAGGVLGRFMSTAPVKFLEGIDPVPTVERTPVMTPGLPEFTPAPMICISVSDFYTAPAENLSEVSLGPVSILPAYLSDGTMAPLSVLLDSANNQMAAFIPWSESTASKFAVIELVQPICESGMGPQVVEITLSHGTPITLTAFDDSGMIVDTLTDDSTFTAGAQVKMKLASISGIHSIQIEGAEVYIYKLCALCVSDIPLPEITPVFTPMMTLPPQFEQCVEVSEYFTEPVTMLDEAALGPVKISKGDNRLAVPLSISACSNDGRLGVYISATTSAYIEFSPNVCDGNAPKVVEVVLGHGTLATLTAFDDSGVEVATAVDTGADSSIIRVMLLNSPTGIRKIKIEGADICIVKICWQCFEIPITPMMTPMFTPGKTPFITPGFTPVLTPISTLPIPTPAGPAKIIYSEEGNTMVAFWIWDFTSSPRVPVTNSEIGLQTGDDVDALGLGEDYSRFDEFRCDVFSLSAGSVGTSGDLLARSSSGKPIERDIYREDHASMNVLYIDDLISQSMGGGTASGVIDDFDIGPIAQGSWVYFSLTPGSPTLALGYSPSDVLVSQYGIPGSLKVYAHAVDLGSPPDIDALSIYDAAGDAVYDPAMDYIIYSDHTPGVGVVYHYGFGSPVGNSAHSHSQFGLLDSDNIYGLEHIYLVQPQITPGTVVTPMGTPMGTPFPPMTPMGTPFPPITPMGTPFPPMTPMGTPFPPMTPMGTPMPPFETPPPMDTPMGTPPPMGTPFPPMTPMGTPMPPLETPPPMGTPMESPPPMGTPMGTPMPPLETPPPMGTPMGTPPPVNTPMPTMPPLDTPLPTMPPVNTPMPTMPPMETPPPMPTNTPMPPPMPTNTPMPPPMPTNTPMPPPMPTNTPMPPPMPTDTPMPPPMPTNTPMPPPMPTPTPF
ncbi:MAG: hypothetical protein AB1656_04020 [Candidatus Omnitrophota bacterium]